MIKRSNLIKGIIAGLMLTTVLGSAVLAGVGSESFYVQYNNKKKVFYGSAGAYGMELEDDGFIVQTCSNSAISRKCELSASQLYYYDNAAMNADFAVDNLIRYEGLVAAIGRYKDPLFNYYGEATTYNTEIIATGILDKYSCTFYQQAAPNVVK